MMRNENCGYEGCRQKARFVLEYAEGDVYRCYSHARKEKLDLDGRQPTIRSIVYGDVEVHVMDDLMRNACRRISRE